MNVGLRGGRWQELVECNCCRIDDMYGGIDGVKIVECVDIGVNVEVLIIR